MKHKRTVQVPASERVETHAITCDLCGKEAPGLRHGDSEWTTEHYAIEETRVEVTVRRRQGSSFPEGAWGKAWSVDICPTCFKAKLVPWLISQGAAIREEDFDF